MEKFSVDKKHDIFTNAAKLIKENIIIITAAGVGQGKNIYQAEIDAICELADFLNFNVKYHQT